METKDFVKELGYLGYTMRLKRISDAMMHEGRRLYNDLDVDIEPNWYVIFKLLKVRGALSVTEIADAIKMAHPSVISIVNKMTKAGYLISKKDDKDSRKREIDLSATAREKLPEYEKIWAAGEAGIEKALKGMDALTFISAMEEIFFSKGFKERTLNELKPNETILLNNDSMADTTTVSNDLKVEILSYNPKYAKDFAELNFEWLEKYFYVEDYDREVLSNPEKYIISPGGEILFAKIKDEIVGTVALINRGSEGYELSKMAVTEKYKGLRIGQKLMYACIHQAGKIGTKRLFLDSNRKLTPAISLYNKVGFKEIPVPADSPYERCNIRMEIYP